MLKRSLSLVLALILTFSVTAVGMVASAAEYTYNPAAAAAYALRWWNDRNTEYKDWSYSGGDCANFVSQCLYAGGIQKTTTWKPSSGAWINVKSLKTFLEGIGCTFVDYCSAADVDVGDVLYYWDPDLLPERWGHVGICVSKGSNGIPWVCAHTTDRHTSDWKLSYSRVAVMKFNSTQSGSVNITSPQNGAWLSPSSPGRVSWTANSGAKVYKYSIRELIRNTSTGQYEETSNLICQNVLTTGTSFSLDKSSNSNLDQYLRSQGAYKIWVGAFSDAAGQTVIAQSTINVYMNTESVTTPNLTNPSITKSKYSNTLYSGTYSGTVDFEGGIDVSWQDTGDFYWIAAKALNGSPAMNDDEAGTTLVSYRKTSDNYLELTESKLSPHAGKYIKIVVEACGNARDNAVSAYYYFRLADNTPAETFTVTYNANGGTVSPSSVSKTSGESTVLPYPQKTATISYNLNGGDSDPIAGDEFDLSPKGWATSRTATSARYSCGQAYTVTGDTTLYAVWESKSVRLPSEIPERAGYTFLGWSTSRTASTASYAANGSYSLTADVTLYAVWEEESEQPGGSATLSAANKTAAVGGEVRIPVTITDNPGFMYLKLKLSYDSSVLSFKTAENGDVSTDTFTIGSDSVLWDSASDATADGLLVTLVFDVADDAPSGDYSIGISSGGCYNSNERTVSLSGTSAKLTVSDMVYGDATGDGNVNGADLIRVRKYLAGLDEGTGISIGNDGSEINVSAGADANGDGDINGVDLIRLRKYLANLDEETGISTVPLGPNN